MDPCEGAQLGAAETLEALPLLLVIPLTADVQGWLAGVGRPRERVGKRAAMNTEHLVWDWDWERQDPCTEHRGKGTLGTLPQRSVFLRKSPAELRLASPLRGPNSTVFSPPITTSSSSFLHSHPPPVLLSVNNSFWFWTSRDQQILEGVGKTLVLDFFFPFSLEFWVFELQKIISINIKIYVFRQMDFLENYERS